MAEPAPPRILFVENDDAAREALVPALEHRGWRVELCASPGEAEARLAAVFYDLLIVDIDLAGGAGRDWLPRVRAMRPGTRILVMTAEGTPASVLSAIREQAFSFFTKPFSPRAVADMAELALATPSWTGDIEIISAAPHWVSLWVRCKLENTERIVQFIREIQTDLTPDQREDAAVALRELLLNAVEHGCHSDSRKRIRVSYIRTARSIVYHIEDPGAGFSFGSIAHSAVANPPDEPVKHLDIRAEQGFRPGGFGILLTRSLADELIYSEKGNEVLFVKYLKAGTRSGE